MHLGTSLTRIFYGYDVFVSYSRRDTRYADFLVKLIGRHRAKHFLDRTDAEPGAELNFALRAALLSSGTMILLCTESAIKSPFVALEVSYFSELKRPIIVVNVDNALNSSPWEGLKKTIYIPESSEALTLGTPSGETSSALSRALKSTSRVKRRKRIIASLQLSALALCLAFAATGFYSYDNLTRLNEQELQAAVRAEQLGDEKQRAGKLGFWSYNEAAEIRQQLLRSSPRDSENRERYIAIKLKMRNSAPAWNPEAELQESINAAGSNAVYISWVAYDLATSPEETLRNGKEALRHALRARELGGENSVEVLRALAAAYACLKDYGKAVEYENRILPLMAKELDNYSEDEKPRRKKEFELEKRKLESFKARKPWTEAILK
jgi:hypothetical protein